MSRFSNLEFGENNLGGREGKPAARDADHYLGEAQSAFVAGRFEKSLRAYSKVLEHDPANARAWTGQVRMLIELGEFREANLWADKGLEVVPDDPELLAVKAVSLARSGDLDAALAFSDAAIESADNSSTVWLARGDVLMARGDKPAEFCFEKSIALAQEQWLAQWLVSRVYYFYEMFSTALKMIQQALETNAARAVLWVQMGRCQLALNLARGAEHSFEQAKQLDPECEGLRDQLARARQVGWFRRLEGWYRQWKEQ